MPTSFSEGRYPGEVLLSEANFHRSRDTITIASGAGVVKAGTVLGRIAVGGATAAAKAGGNTGNGTFTLDVTTPVVAGARPGVYTVRCIAAAANSGTFRVEDPDGTVMGDVVVAATFEDDIKFVIADGATDFIVGDGFDVTVAAGSGKYVPSPVTGSDGTQLAVAVNLYEVDASSADVKVAAVTRAAELVAPALQYATSVDDATKRGAKHAQLAAAGLIVR